MRKLRPALGNAARAINTLARIGLAATGLLAGASVQAADPSLRFDDNFSSPGNWADFSKPHSTLAVSDGRLKVTRGEGSYTNAEQPVSVRPVARWRATVDLTFTDYAADDKQVRGGLSVSGPLDQRFYVLLDPEGDVTVLYYDGNEWVDKDPLPYTRATGAKPGKGARNTLSIERESGYFRIYVNGVHVGRTRIIDFTPRKVGIALKSAAALTTEFDNLRLDELGIDSRFSRLINNEGTPGAKNLLIDNFDRKRGQQETWWVGTDKNKFAEVRDGRYLLEVKNSVSTWVTGNPGVEGRGNLDPDLYVYAGYQVSAVITPVGGDTELGRGIVSVGTQGENDKYSPYVALQVSGKHFRVIYSDGAGEDHKLVGWTETPSLDPKGANHLTLTELPDGRFLVFLNSDYQLSVPTPQYFRMTTVGVTVTGPQSITVDNFYAREI